MNNYPPLEYEKYYHIYNQGNNREALFREPVHYEHFLELLQKYILFIADIYAWVLMGNHFHILVRIFEEKEIGFLPPRDASRSSDPGRSCLTETFHRPQNMEGSARIGKKPIPYRQFAHLFNAYTKYFNNRTNRSGSLFLKNFKRRIITNENDLRNTTLYIHHNPVHHGFTDNFRDYPWTSYDDIISTIPTFIKRKEVINWFNNIENFKAIHQKTYKYQTYENICID